MTKFAACFTPNKLFYFASCTTDCLYTKDKKSAGQGFSAVRYHLACPLNYCTKQTTMQIQALNLVLTSLHKGVSKFKNS